MPTQAQTDWYNNLSPQQQTDFGKMIAAQTAQPADERQLSLGGTPTQGDLVAGPQAPTGLMTGAATTQSAIDFNSTREPGDGTGNQSLVTGKTWADMNPVEQAAHQIARGQTPLNTDPAVLAQANQYLTEQYGGTDQGLFKDIQDQAVARIGYQQGTGTDAYKKALNIQQGYAPTVSGYTAEQDQWFADNEWFEQPAGFIDYTPGQQFAEGIIQNVNTNGLDQFTPEQQAAYKDSYYNEGLTAGQRQDVFASGWTKDERLETYAADPSGRAAHGNWERTFDPKDPNYDAGAAADYATLRMNDSRDNKAGVDTMDEISQWYTDMRSVSKNDPEAMGKWIQDNPTEAIRFYALNGIGGWNGAGTK